MFNFFRSQLRGMFSLLFFVANLVVHCSVFYATIIVLAVLPFKKWRIFWRKRSNSIAMSWIAANGLGKNLTQNFKIVVEGGEDLSKNNWYLVLSNHQSWVDIHILQTVFRKRIPFLKFFLKKELIWVPFLGLAWWALEFPFMKRYSKEFIKKNPHLKGKDIEITRRACSKFKRIPVSVMNFVEGTRFDEEKHKKQDSPYKQLLRPKAGGIAFVLGVMGEQLTNIVNVTIYYKDGPWNFWDFLCGRIDEVRVVIETIPITEEIVGDYENDQVFRKKFQHWLTDLWHKKDALLTRIDQEYKDRT